MITLKLWQFAGLMIGSCLLGGLSAIAGFWWASRTIGPRF